MAMQRKRKRMPRVDFNDFYVDDDGVIDTTKKRDDLTIIQMSEIEPRDVEWVWPPFLPKGEITLIEGDSDGGKSTVAIDILARISYGRRLPLTDELSYGEDGKIPYGDSLIMSKEDDPHTTIRPRLDAARADNHKIHYVGYSKLTKKGEMEIEPFGNFKHSMYKLEEILRLKLFVQVILIDPLSDFAAPYNLNDEAQARQFLAPIRGLARKYNLAILAVRHIGKDNDAVHRGLGSVATRAVSRSQWIIGSHPEDPDWKVLVQAKNNLSGDVRNAAIRFRLRPWRGNEKYARVEWGNRLEIINPAEVLKPKKELSKKEKAIEIIGKLLADGREAQAIVEKAVYAEGISKRTMMSAKSEMRVISIRMGRVWFWELPSSGIERVRLTPEERERLSNDAE